MTDQDAFKDVDNWNEEELNLARSIHLDREFALALAQELNGNTEQDWQARAADVQAVADESDDEEDDIAPAPRVAPAYHAPAYNAPAPAPAPAQYRAPAYNAPPPAPVPTPAPAPVRNFNQAPAPSVRTTQNIVVPDEDEDFGWSFSF
jgi:hypothetical protein